MPSRKLTRPFFMGRRIAGGLGERSTTRGNSRVQSEVVSLREPTGCDERPVQGDGLRSAEFRIRQPLHLPPMSTSAFAPFVEFEKNQSCVQAGSFVRVTRATGDFGSLPDALPTCREKTGDPTPMVSRQALRSYLHLMPTDPGEAQGAPLTGSEPRGDYLDRLMRRESFAALWPLFAKATKPAKELTESFSALVHLRPFMEQLGPCRVIHVGDGAHARTAALFALKSATENISVDPVINMSLVSSWQENFQVERLSWRKACLSEVATELNALPPLPVLVTFVHAHIDTDETLSLLRWDAAFSLTCCMPGKQLSRMYVPSADSEDLCVLSEGRRFQVLTNPESPYLAAS